jgi:hypothetical protein
MQCRREILKREGSVRLGEAFSVVRYGRAVASASTRGFGPKTHAAAYLAYKIFI